MVSGAPPIFAAFSASSCSSLGLPSWLSYHPGNLVVSEFTYAILTLGAMELWRKTNKPGSKSSWHYLGFPLRLVLPFAGQNQGVAVFHALAAKAPISSKAHTQGTTDDTSIGDLRPGADQQMTRVYIEKKIEVSRHNSRMHLQLDQVRLQIAKWLTFSLRVLLGDAKREGERR